jgi:tRNA(Ile2) C34 agmatinyltransferase TiaS
MGDIADMMLDGDLCEGCGVYMGSAGQGFSRRCASCSREHKAANKVANVARNQAEHAAAQKIPCPVCGKRIKTVGMADHVKDAHGGAA